MRALEIDPPAFPGAGASSPPPYLQAKLASGLRKVISLAQGQRWTSDRNGEAPPPDEEGERRVGWAADSPLPRDRDDEDEGGAAIRAEGRRECCRAEETETAAAASLLESAGIGKIHCMYGHKGKGFCQRGLGRKPAMHDKNEGSGRNMCNAFWFAWGTTYAKDSG